MTEHHRSRRNSTSQTGETRLNDYRARWRAIDAEEFTETVCPTCHQPLPAEQVAEAREAFAAYQQQRKDTLLEDSKLVKQGIAAAQERLASAETALKSAQDEVQKAQMALDSYTPPVIVRAGEPAGLRPPQGARFRRSSRTQTSGLTACPVIPQRKRAVWKPSTPS